MCKKWLARKQNSSNNGDASCFPSTRNTPESAFSPTNNFPISRGTRSANSRSQILVPVHVGGASNIYLIRDGVKLVDCFDFCQFPHPRNLFQYQIDSTIECATHWFTFFKSLWNCTSMLLTCDVHMNTQKNNEVTCNQLLLRRTNSSARRRAAGEKCAATYLEIKRASRTINCYRQHLLLTALRVHLSNIAKSLLCTVFVEGHPL